MIMMPRRAVRRLLLSIGATLASAWAVPVSAGPLTYEQAVRLAAANAPSLKARAAATAGAMLWRARRWSVDHRREQDGAAEVAASFLASDWEQRIGIAHPR